MPAQKERMDNGAGRPAVVMSVFRPCRLSEHVYTKFSCSSPPCLSSFQQEGSVVKAGVYRISEKLKKYSEGEFTP